MEGFEVPGGLAPEQHPQVSGVEAKTHEAATPGSLQPTPYQAAIFTTTTQRCERVLHGI